MLTPLLATQMLTPSNARPAAPSPTANTPSVAPSDPRSLLTVPSKKFVTQTLAPSKATPKGPLPTANVPSTAPVAPSSFVTVSLMLFATQRLAPSQAAPSGRLPTETVPSVAPSLARTRVNVFLNCDATHSEAPSKASASAPPPEPATSGTSRRMGISLDPGTPSGCPVGAWDDLGSDEDERGTGARVTTSASPPARRWCGLEDHSQPATKRVTITSRA